MTVPATRTSGDPSRTRSLARLTRLLESASKVYQPIYGLPEVKTRSPLRGCVDRCEALEQMLGDGLAGLRIVDIGCSLGYMSHHFAARGAVVHGVDSDETYVQICREIAALTGSPATFEHASLGRPFVDALAPDRFDAAFLFSMLHHLIRSIGLAPVQQLVADLLDRIPMLLVETALAEEVPPPGYDWDEHLPANELDLFALCDAGSIDLVGRFPTHVGAVHRPLYRVVRRGPGNGDRPDE